MDPSVLAIVSSFTAVITSALLSILKDKVPSADLILEIINKIYSDKDKKVTSINELSVSISPVKALTLQRLSETKQAYKNEKFKENFSQLSNGLLIFTQYVIGGLLLSSFVQQNFTSGTIGSLGVVVLAATIVNQKFRPDLNASVSKTKVSWLFSTIIRVENRLALMEQGTQSDEKYEEIINLLTDTLISVNDPEKWSSYDAKNKEDNEASKSSGA